MRFSCASTESVIPEVEDHKRVPRKAQAPKKRALTSRKKPEGEPRMKTRSASRAARLQNAAQALKKKEKQAEVVNKAPDPYIYVGNLQGGVTEDRLTGLFSHCGQVTRVQIRCSGGQAITVGVQIPDAVKGPRDRQYATVEFSHFSAVRRALQLDGQVLNGVRLVVTVSAADLPEMKDIVDTRMKQIRSRGVPRVRQYIGRFPRIRQPTELCITNKTEKPPQARAADKFNIMGYSFAATLI